MWSITKTLLGQGEVRDELIKTDPHWGFSEFPAPGDPRKHLLPVFIDPEEIEKKDDEDLDDTDETSGRPPVKEFWMPDKYCKVCYGCEELFTMFRRRHHCRMCGQIFCNTCSSYSMDGAIFNTPGTVRACRLCYEQALEASEQETKFVKRRTVEKTEKEVLQSHQVMREISAEYNKSIENLQNRASLHLAGIVSRLIDGSLVLNSNQELWKETILTLVKGVVASVDPDVRAGDELDIRPYVKIKVIPGGSIAECSYVDGIVFRKNVSHKKMGANGTTKSDPRIILLAGGIEFQRADAKLASMDTLIEQEDKYMEMLVGKIMSLKPDIILVGKSVARKAQEILCEHRVIVMQNVKLQLLERLSRMTGALLLPSADNMIKQYGEECLGSCGSFHLRLVQDDPEKSAQLQPSRILRTRICRASTYAYVQGCPSERGCTIVLRGEVRTVLKEIKRIIRFSVLVAYHLRLEVAYYNDRFADLPAINDNDEDDEDIIDDSSDIDDELIDEQTELQELALPTNTKLAQYIEKNPTLRSRTERKYLSMSMDVDVLTPRRKELLGAPVIRYKPITPFHIESHQTLLITSVLMGESMTMTQIQKSPADVKAIQYYTAYDVPVGKFIIENCFQLTRNWQHHHAASNTAGAAGTGGGGVSSGREPQMLDQTLSYVHRFGRVDITVRKERGYHHHHGSVAGTSAAGVNTTSGAAASAEDASNASNNSGMKNPLKVPIAIQSYCKDCGRIVTPPHIMSEEVWKMSFGKFLELLYYNRTARCTVGKCRHRLRDSHILSFLCEGYMAVFEFIPIHPYTLLVRNHMTFPEEFYVKSLATTLSQLPSLHWTLMEDFRSAISVLEREIKEILAGRAEDMALAMADVQMIEHELDISSISFFEQLLHTYDAFTSRYQGLLHSGELEFEAQVKATVQDRLMKLRGNVNADSTTVADSSNVLMLPASAAAVLEEGAEGISSERERETIIAHNLSTNSITQQQQQQQQQFLAEGQYLTTNFNPKTATLFPAIHFRDTYIRGSRWNTRIDNIYKFLESVRTMLMQQQATPAPAVATISVAAVTNGKDHSTQVAMIAEATAAAVPVTSDDELVASGQRLQSTTEPSPSLPSTIAVEGQAQQAHVPSVITTTTSTAAGEGGITSLYRAAQEQNRKTAEKPNDKMSRITKALSRFLVGNKGGDNNEEGPKFFVPLAEFGHGRYGLEPGRNGIVVPVIEESHATIIAYALASQQYYDGLQASIREGDNVDHGDFDDDIAAVPTRMPPPITVNSSRTATTTTTSKAGSGSNKAPALSPVPEGEEDHEHDHELDEDLLSPLNQDHDHDHTSSSPVKKNQYALTGLGLMNNEQEQAQQDMIGGAGQVSAFGLDGGHTQPSTAPTSPGGASDANSAVSNNGSRTRANISQQQQQQANQSGKGRRESVRMPSSTTSSSTERTMDSNEKQMISQDKSTLRIRFDDCDDRGNLLVKFQCQVYWAKQFEALRCCYFQEEDSHENFIRSLAMSARWSAQGGKSGATFARTSDERMVIKVISRVELQMFLDFAPAYFEYMAKAYYQPLPTVLCKILGVYTVRYDNKESGKRMSENVVVMENIFYQRSITKTFDLKGSSRARYVEVLDKKGDFFDERTLKRRRARRRLQEKRRLRHELPKNGDANKVSKVKKLHDSDDDSDAHEDEDSDHNEAITTAESAPTKHAPPSIDDIEDESTLLEALSEVPKISQVLLDDNLMEFTRGRPFPMKPKAKYFFKLAVDNDTLFLSIVNVVDYSILVGFDENKQEMVVGIIDYLRQYDIIKKMERVGKGSVGMLTGQAEPTIIQPSQYRKRFSLAMERYFMTVPDKWIAYERSPQLLQLQQQQVQQQQSGQDKAGAT